MVKTNLKILKHEDKTSQNGKDYCRFDCVYGDGSHKWMSVFEKDIIKDLKESEGRLVSVEVEQSADGKFWNIRQFHGCIAGNLTSDEIDSVVNGEHPTQESVQKIRTPDPTTTMYVSYAKDIFIAMINDDLGSKTERFNTNLEERMKIAIQLVKQAQEAFS